MYVGRYSYMGTVCRKRTGAYNLLHILIWHEKIWRYYLIEKRDKTHAKNTLVGSLYRAPSYTRGKKNFCTPFSSFRAPLKKEKKRINRSWLCKFRLYPYLKLRRISAGIRYYILCTIYHSPIRRKNIPIPTVQCVREMKKNRKRAALGLPTAV